jgi:selT/selW/selH-like putative selenoprotein
VESGGGVFEVTVDGRLVHSKKATGEHADPERVVRDIREGASG